MHNFVSHRNLQHCVRAEFSTNEVAIEAERGKLGGSKMGIYIEIWNYLHHVVGKGV